MRDGVSARDSESAMRPAMISARDCGNTTIQEQVKRAFRRRGVDIGTAAAAVKCTKKQERAGILHPTPALACIT